ncbi:DUF1080 domain-containing protein [Pontiellaceae bacterium B12227]|nr:DUF1080 domain-containing protein [Pontiellaceae bacterium B12227]
MKYSVGFVVSLFLVMPFLSMANDAVEPAVTGEGAVDLLADGLAGWSVPSNLWNFEAGVITGDTGGERINIPQWIYTRQRYDDFEFTCELMLSGDTGRNTGIYFRVNPFRYESRKGKKTFEAPSGYEFDTAFHRPGKRNYRGTLGDWYARPKLRIFPDPNIINDAYKTDEWNRMTIRARENRLEYWINGIKVMDFCDPDPKGSREGIIGFQIHDGSVMKVEYRNIRIRSL